MKALGHTIGNLQTFSEARGFCEVLDQSDVSTEVGTKQHGKRSVKRNIWQKYHLSLLTIILLEYINGQFEDSAALSTLCIMPTIGAIVLAPAADAQPNNNLILVLTLDQDFIFLRSPI